MEAGTAQRLAVLVLAGVLASAAPAAAGPREDPLAGARFAGVPAAERAVVRGALDRAPTVARRLVRLVAPRLTVRRGRGHGRRSVAWAVPVAGGDVRYVIRLARVTLSGRGHAAHVILHELGHVVDHALVGDELRADLRAAFAASPRWRPCFPHRDGCVSEPELFADQFAYWAAPPRRGGRAARSAYGDPPLLSRRAFGALMERAGWSPGTPLGFGR